MSGDLLNRMAPSGPPPDSATRAGSDSTLDLGPGRADEGDTLPSVGRFRVIGRIGAGGMGVVYRAADPRLNRVVALKLLPPRSLPDACAAARFRREATALAALSHPGIVQVFDFGEDDGRPFLVMEYVEGRDLLDAIRGDGPMPVALAADAIRQAAEALHHAHGRGLVHRDLKPSNLIRSADGRVKVLDLGLAHFVQDGGPDPPHSPESGGMGTPDYMAPEQFRDARDADPRTDVYALGCSLYHLLAGRPPFPCPSIAGKRLAHERDEPAPLDRLRPDVPARLAAVVRRMLAKDPGDRFPDAASVAAALAPFAEGPVGAPGRPVAMPAASARPRLLVALAASLLAAAFVLLALLGPDRRWSVGRPSPPASGVSGGARPDRPASPGPSRLADPGLPDVLTVAKDGPARFRTISAAVASARPGRRILVLDDATYEEAVLLDGPDLDGVSLESPLGAAIRAPEGHPALAISGVADARVRGFRLSRTPEDASHAIAFVMGPLRGVLLEGLELDIPDETGLYLKQVEGRPGHPALVVRRCTFRGGRTGVVVEGPESGEGGGGGVLLCDNEFQGGVVGIYTRGQTSRVMMAGNRLIGSRKAGFWLNVPGPGGSAGPILVANNTIVGPDAPGPEAADPSGILILFNVDATTGVADWLSVRNNVISARVGRAIDCFAQDASPRDGRLTMHYLDAEAAERPLLSAATFGWNCRDLSGNVPLGPGDRELFAPDFNLDDPGRDDYLRPPSGSSLGDCGPARGRPALPPYVGAVPPHGVGPWDWERTWADWTESR